MIVIYQEKGWEVITQRAHGIVAAQLGFHWKSGERPRRWVETLLAIAEHDDAENELDGERLLTETGGPLNFAMKNFELAHCRKLASLTITKSRYIALLTSMHMEFLYQKDTAGNKEAAAFLEEQKQLQASWRKALGISREEALKVYNLLEWCDALSLLLCKGDLQPEERKVEISTGPDRRDYYLQQTGEYTVSVTPWPFEEDSFSVSWEYRVIGQMAFTSSEAFREAFLQAEVLERSWRVEKQERKSKKEEGAKRATKLPARRGSKL